MARPSSTKTRTKTPVATARPRAGSAPIGPAKRTSGRDADRSRDTRVSVAASAAREGSAPVVGVWAY